MRYKDQKRYSIQATITVRDRLLGNTCVMKFTVGQNDKSKLMEKVNEETKRLNKTVLKDVEITDKYIKDRIADLKKKGWGNTRINNFFARFDVDADLPKTKRKSTRKLKKGQTTLINEESG